MKKTMQKVMDYMNKNEKAIKLIGSGVYAAIILVVYLSFMKKWIKFVELGGDDEQSLAEEIKDLSKSWDAPLE